MHAIVHRRHNVAGKLLEAFPLFSLLDDGLVSAACSALKPQLFLPQQTIVAAGDMGRQVFFIRRGTVKVRVKACTPQPP